MDNSLNSIDSQMMQRCIELAQRAIGKTSPNPMVGAIVVKNGEIIGEGFHPGIGQPHAEVFALREAGENARGATIYVSLEPCNHYGRTPPCSEALVAAGVSKVVVGMIDPNPLVGGKGIERLREAGIEVVVGVEEESCRRLNEGFIHRMVHQRPLGILKYAMTIDGKIATDTGHSRWISSSPARDYVHRLRMGCDAIIVGGNTVRQDNPILTSHQLDRPNPLRVIMTRNLDLPLDAHVWDTTIAPTLVMTNLGVNPPLQDHLRQKGVEVIELTEITPTAVMAELNRRSFLSVLWECGGVLSAQAIQQGAVQKILAFIAPKIIGGSLNYSPVGDLGISNMTEGINLQNVTWEPVGDDLLITGYL
jgi:diaminohydroxyphosphoribosylaminopyrimidine deaminase/5-amino-6-(5-phosphoribosylamino)uracil reductase